MHIDTNNNKAMFYFKLFVCLFYGLVSIAQTLTNRYLFRTLQFKFYSTVFIYLGRSSSCRDLSSSSSHLRTTPTIVGIFSARKCWSKWHLIAFLSVPAIFLPAIVLLLCLWLPIWPSRNLLSFLCLLLGSSWLSPTPSTGCITAASLPSLLEGLWLEATKFSRDNFWATWLHWFTPSYRPSLCRFQLCCTKSTGFNREVTDRLTKLDLMVANSILSLPYYFTLLIF